MLHVVSSLVFLRVVAVVAAATATTPYTSTNTAFAFAVPPSFCTARGGGRGCCTQLYATVPDQQTQQSPGSIDARRKILFQRKGPHFSLNRGTARIEFGDTIMLTNDRLTNNNNAEILDDWLRDPAVFGQALWRSDMLSRQGNSSSNGCVFRMGLLPLEFILLKFEPWVEVRCKTVQDSQGNPIFTLQSIGHDPNPTHITFVPGMPSTLTLDDVVKNLKIQVEVVGQVGRRKGKMMTTESSSSSSLRGTMVYQVTGTLPSALLLFPDPLLKAAAETINRQVVQFAQEAFQMGTKEQFPIYLKSRLQTQQKEPNNN